MSLAENIEFLRRLPKPTDWPIYGAGLRGEVESPLTEMHGFGSNPGNLATDQRGAGFVRTIDFDACRRPNVHVTDIGAYEYRGDTIFCHGFEG